MRSLNVLLLACGMFAASGARSQSNFALFLSSNGDIVGNGATDMTANPADFVVSGPASAFQVTALGRYLVSFGGPGGADLTVGQYTNATHYPSNGPLPGLDIANTKTHVSCSANCGSFFIKEIHADTNGQVDRLWVTFTNWCTCSSPGALAGEIRFNSQLAELATLFINCPSTVTAVTPFGQNSTGVNYPPPDGTPGGWISSYPPSGSVFVAGTNRVQATLLYGTNSLDCSFSVVVQVTPFATVQLNKVPDDPVYQAPASLHLYAMANTDAFETIESVSFLLSNTVVLVVTNPPRVSGMEVYSANLALNTLPAGYYSFQAIARNSSGISATSAVASVTVTTNLLQNGGFEAGDFRNWTLLGSPPVYGSPYNLIMYTAYSYYAQWVIHGGNNGAYLGDIRVASISQTVATTPGQYYLLSLWVNNPFTGTTQFLGVNWNTNSASTNALLTMLNPPALPWTKLQFLVMATETNAEVELQAENDPSFFGLDDIYLTPMPYPAFQSTAMSADGFHLSWRTAPGIAYQVQYTTNLLHPTWTDLVPPFVASGDTFTVVDTNSPSSSQRFYRLVLP